MTGLTLLHLSLCVGVFVYCVVTIWNFVLDRKLKKLQTETTKENSDAYVKYLKNKNTLADLSEEV